MTAIFYKTNDNPLKLNKTLDSLTALQKTVNLLKPSNILNLVISVSDFNPSYNFVSLPIFNRFYFVTDILIQNNGLFFLTLKEDVLYTYRNIILQNNHHVIKNDNAIGNNIEYVEKFEKTILTQDIENPFKDHISDVLISMKG